MFIMGVAAWVPVDSSSMETVQPECLGKPAYNLRVLMLRSSLLLALCAGVSLAAPNFLVVLVDDLGWKHVGYQGGAYETPRINRLASESMIFSRAYIPTPTYSPSRGGIADRPTSGPSRNRPPHPYRPEVWIRLIRAHRPRVQPLGGRPIALALTEPGCPSTP